MNRLKCVKTFNTRTEAEVAKGFLLANGIKASVLGYNTGGVYPYDAWKDFLGVKLLVHERDFQKAAEALDQLNATTGTG
jgi:hypothetical protein